MTLTFRTCQNLRKTISPLRITLPSCLCPIIKSPPSALGTDIWAFVLPLPPTSPKRLDIVVGLYYICIYCTDLSFLTSSPYLQSTFVYAMRGGMELPAFLLLSSNNIQQKAHYDHITTKECGKKSSELYQYYEFGTYLTVNEHTHVWLICLN